MNRNVIPRNWYYYYDGNNPKSFKKWVLKYLNDTTETENEAYTGKNYPRYYGMINGEPFVRKKEKAAIFWDEGCTLIPSASDFYAVYDSFEGEDICDYPSENKVQEKPSNELRISRINNVSDLTLTSWVIRRPDAMVLNFINSVTVKEFLGKSAAYGIYVTAKDGRIRSKSLSEEMLQKAIDKGVLLYDNHFISNLLIVNEDIKLHKNSFPQNDSNKARLHNEFENELKKMESERYNIKIHSPHGILRMDEVEPSPRRSAISFLTYSEQKEQTGLKALSLPAPIIIKRRKK